jgi:hypothetical protein
MVYVAVGLDAEKEEMASVVAAHVSVVVLKLFVEQTISLTVSLVGTVSGSVEDAKKETTAPGSFGELSEKSVNVGRLFTLNGDRRAPVPCFATELQRGFVATASHTHAYQMFCSANGATSVVVVAAVEVAPLAVNDDTAHRTALVPHVGAAPEFAVGVLLLLQMRR